MHQGKINQINSLVVKVWKKEEVVFEITHACSIRANRFLFFFAGFYNQKMENMPSANGDKNTAAHRRSAPACVRLPILVTHTGNKRRIRATTCTNAQKQGWLIRQSFPLLLFQYFFIIRDRFILNFMFSQLKSSRVLQYRTAASRKCCSYCLRKWEQQRSIDSLLSSVL